MNHTAAQMGITSAEKSNKLKKKKHAQHLLGENILYHDTPSLHPASFDDGTALKGEKSPVKNKMEKLRDDI